MQGGRTGPPNPDCKIKRWTETPAIRKKNAARLRAAFLFELRKGLDCPDFSLAYSE